MKLKLLIAIFVSILADILALDSAKIKSKIETYFDSDVINSFKKQWQKEKVSFEHSILLTLKQQYGNRAMNIYVKKPKDYLKISEGFFVSDNVVKVLYVDLTLRSLPLMEDPGVTLALASNVFRIDTDLSKMFIDSKYVLFRNQSDIMYSGTDQDPYKYSPFTFQQVHPTGSSVIIAEDCRLEGVAIVTLNGDSVNIGHNAFKLNNCKFTVEISKIGMGLPPVIAPYFSEEQREQLQKLILPPVTDEVMRKLQATLFTFLNTSVVLDDLPKYRYKIHTVSFSLPRLETDSITFRKDNAQMYEKKPRPGANEIFYQEELFKTVADYSNEVANNMNKIIITNNLDSTELPYLQIYWSESRYGKLAETLISFLNVTLYGIDSLYSAHSGGPYKIQKNRILEEFRFQALQVRGFIIYENETHKEQCHFAAEIHDVVINVNIDVDSILDDGGHQLDVIKWRSIEYTMYDPSLFIKEGITLNFLISGYLVKEIPEYLSNYLSDLLTNTITGNDKTDFANKVNRQDNIMDKQTDVRNSIEIADENNPENSVGVPISLEADSPVKI